MNTVKVELGSRSYDILIGSGALNEIKNSSSARTLAVMDSTVRKLHGKQIQSALEAEDIFTFPAGEGSKTPENAISICRHAAHLNFDRKCRFAAAGGGVTGDLTGFAAAIYMRGIEFIQIPTTLLAAVDSGIGGKTAVNIAEGKNLAGAFHQPSAVFIDTDLLMTLPETELENGLAEIVKTAVILDPELFAKLEKNPAGLLNKSAFQQRYPEIITRCCELKGMIVAEDEKENGRRAILNYGHTFGHALELLSNYSLPHGQAVSIGMAAAGELAVMLGIRKKADLERQNKLLAALGLPVRLPAKYHTCDLVAAMRRDKKNHNGITKVVLCPEIGSAMLPVGSDEKDLAAAWEKIR